MGKPKTDNKDEANGEIMEESATPSSTKKGKKSRKNKDVDWEDEVAKDLEDLTLEDGGGEKREASPEAEAVPEKKNKKKEKKSKKSRAKYSDDEDEEVVVKSKRGGGFAALMVDDDDDDDFDGDDDEPVVEEKKEKKKPKKEEKPKPKADSDDEEEEVIVKAKKGGGFAALMADDDDDDDDDDIEEQIVEEKKEKKKPKREEKPKKEEKLKKEEKPKPKADSDEEEEVIVKTKKGGGFAALMADDDDDDDDDDDIEEQIVEEKKEVKKNKKKEEKPKPAEDKKKGKKGKKKKNDEEDLDKILAELELEYKGEKPKEATEEAPPVEETSKKKKKKKKEADTDTKFDVPVEKETMPETPKEAEKAVPEAPKEAVPETPKEVVPETPKEAVPETPKEAVPETPKEAVPETPKEAVPETPKEAVPETPKEAVPETLKEAVPETPKEAVPETPKEAVPETPKEAVPETTKDAETPGEVKPEEPSEDKAEGDGTPAEPSKAKKKKKKAKDKEAAAVPGEDSKEGTPAPEDQGGEAGDDEGTGKKKGKKKKEAVEDDKEARKGKPSKKALAVMREILAKQKEDEDRHAKEEAERLRLEEEQLKQMEEEKKIEQERKERKKQKEKERKERLKAEGKLLTPKQKADMRRAQEMIEHRKAQGMVVPDVGEKKHRPGTRIKPKKLKKEEGAQEEPSPPKEIEEKPADEEVPEVVVEVKEVVEEVKDAWDESSEGEDEDTSEATDSRAANKNNAYDDDDDSEGSESDDAPEEVKGEAVKRREKAIARMAKRKEDNVKTIDPENLRAPVVCVLGHVDHGKTKILDKLRKSNVQEGEVGGITQQIGATNVPAYAVRKQTHMVKDFDMDSLKFPGLLIIDTPGHESFRNLRSRGSSLCDIAILVVDITQGLEPQTRESVNLLRKRGTPFLVALNKVDRVYEWISHPSKDIREMINLQEEHSKNDFERRTAQIIQGLREEKLNSALFWENPNPKEYLSLVPTSAISGDGMGNLIALICNLCQQRLKKNLVFTEELQCTVLEVKTIQGHGTTIDVILVNGRLREGDTIILAGTEGPIVTQIRSLLLPKPLREIRVKGQYDEVKEISAAQGVKIAARELEKAIPGLSLKVAYHEDEVDIIKEEVDREFNSAMRSMKVKERGVYVQASTLGALEALLEFFKTNSVPYSGIRVGPVVKRDVMRAAAMLEHDPMYAVILAFDVKVEKDAQDLADKEGVKIFSEETIYHLGDRYVNYLKEYKKKKQDEFRHIAVFPCRLKIIPTAIFNKRDPIVLGVNIESGVLRTGTPLCVPTKEFVEIGIVTSLEFDHKNVDHAKKGDEVCIKIENVPGHTPKLFGRHFEAEDFLVSKISRESINACKDYFRDDLGKPEWKLMIDLKKQFQIL